MTDFQQFLRAEWDRIAGWACLAVGVVALALGFMGVRTSADVIDEISYLVSGGIGAMFLLGVGATLLLSADLHDDFRKLHRVEEKLDAIHRVLAAEHPELLDQPPSSSGAEVNSEPEMPTGNGARRSLARMPGALAVQRARQYSMVAILLAGTLFAAGSIRTAGVASTDDLSGGVGLALVGALAVAGVVGVLVGQLKGLLESRKQAVLGPLGFASNVGTASLQRPEPASRVWVIDGLARYHRAGCHALRGREAAERDRAGLASGVSPCGLCEPD